MTHFRWFTVVTEAKKFLWIRVINLPISYRGRHQTAAKNAKYYLAAQRSWHIMILCKCVGNECVSKIRQILSVIHYTVRKAVCFQFTHFLVMIERKYILCLIIIIKSEVWTITHCLGLGHETMVCAVCLFCILGKVPNGILNSSPPSATYMRQLIGPALIQIRACHLFGTKPLFKPMLSYC